LSQEHPNSAAEQFKGISFALRVEATISFGEKDRHLPDSPHLHNTKKSVGCHSKILYTVTPKAIAQRPAAGRMPAKGKVYSNDISWKPHWQNHDYWQILE